MTYKKNWCIMCLEILTDSICEKCYKKEINFWLRDLEINSHAREIVINKIKKELSFEILNEIKCIYCGESISICSNCFFSKTTKILNEINFPKNLIENFNGLFNHEPFKNKNIKFVYPEIKNDRCN